jgi:hypothetical protein
MPGEKRRKQKRPHVAAAFRFDATRRLVRVLVVGASLVLVGSLLSAAGMLVAHGHLSPAGRGHLRAATDVVGNALPEPALVDLWPGALGLLLVVSGALFSLVALRRVLSEEHYVALRADGALFVRGKERRLLRWADVEDVRAGEGRVVFALHDGEVSELDVSFSGSSNEEVARVAREVRRKALFGLLR